MSFSDCSYMRSALELAKKARFNCPPNPAVGCVIVKDRRIIGEGFTQKTGEAHAEVMALRDAASRGESVAGATVYVTLEPCSHYGRTPPCALALKNAKVARVVAALKDPNPLVAGKGLKMLEEAGVKVECGLEAEEAEEINRGFLKRQREEIGRASCRERVYTISLHDALPISVIFSTQAGKRPTIMLFLYACSSAAKAVFDFTRRPL